MATLIFATIGRQLGGGIGQIIGATIGQRIDQKLFGPKGRKGPRLNDLSVQDSSYGTPIPKLFGANRVSGSVIWSTDLIESRKKVSQGKGQPKATVYSYAASFAVALSARPVVRIGRIWADGKLFRGEAGDFKTQTGFRLHLGGEGQTVDPLIASLEGVANAPAHRGLAYAVFENMQLGDYGNRIPSLSFEVFADDGPVAIGALLKELGGDTVEANMSTTLLGFGAYGDSVRSVAETLGAAIPFSAVDDGQMLTMTDLPNPAIPVSARQLGASADGARVAPLAVERRSASTVPETLSVAHYEVARDFQQGLQRARRDGGARRDVRIDAPLVLGAGAAKAIAERQLGRIWDERVEARVRLSWSRLDLKPGQSVLVAGSPEHWRIRGLSFEKMVVEAELVRTTGVAEIPTVAEAGRIVSEIDALHGPTVFHLIDLPPLSEGLADTPSLVVAANGPSPGWRSAALLSSIDSGATWQDAGVTALPATIGMATAALLSASSRIVDQRSMLDVTLLNAAMTLSDADEASIRSGVNLAMIGEELIQFRRAQPLGGLNWRLSGFSRGLRGTEWAIANHGAGERFVLLESDALAPLSLTPGIAELRVTASGLGDGVVPSQRNLSMPGQAIIPISPAHLITERVSSGDTIIRWKRRSRNGWPWLDGADAPLGEDAEAYVLTLTPNVGAAISFETSAGEAIYSATQRATHQSGGATFVTASVRQRGRFGLSRPTTVLFSLN